MIELYMDEWFYNMGILGLFRILEYAKEKDAEVNYSVNGNCLAIDEKILDNFAEYYFDYFTEKYSQTLYSDLIVQLDRIESSKKIGNLRGFLESSRVEKTLEVIKEVLSVEEKKELEQVLEKVKKTKRSRSKNGEEAKELSDEEFLKVTGFLRNIFAYTVRNDVVKRRRGLSLLRNDFYDNFFGQISFLQKTLTKESFEVQLAKFKEDFVEPVKALIEEEEKNDKETNEGKRRKRILEHTCMLCRRHKAKVYDDSFFGSYFIPLGMTKEATNFMWNGNLALPICEICILVLMCTPAGATKITDYSLISTLQGNRNATDNTFFAFVNVTDSLELLIQYNNMLLLRRSEDVPFQNFFKDLAEFQKVKFKWMLDNVTLFEFRAEYESKRSHVRFSYIDRGTAEFLLDEMDEIDKLKNDEYKVIFLSRILFGGSLTEVMYAKLRELLKNERTFEMYDVYRMAVLKALIDTYRSLNGGDSMQEQKGKVKAILYKAYRSGQELRRALEQNNAANKLPGIGYRLLNFARVGDKNTFADSIIRLYVSQSMKVPDILLSMLNDYEVDFETLAYAYISGLLGEDFSNKNAGEE
ncbi:type I-B CRISPR-associated protein Cas8b1/Cst1 [Fervidobacterium sp.]